MKKTQSLHSLLVSQSTNFLDLEFSVAKQDKVDRGYKPINCPQKCCAILWEKPFYWVSPAILLIFQFYLTPDIRIFLKFLLQLLQARSRAVLKHLRKFPRKHPWWIVLVSKIKKNILPHNFSRKFSRIFQNNYLVVYYPVALFLIRNVSWLNGSYLFLFSRLQCLQSIFQFG